jgi:hypothetical protein
VLLSVCDKAGNTANCKKRPPADVDAKPLGMGAKDSRTVRNSAFGYATDSEREETHTASQPHGCQCANHLPGNAASSLHDFLEIWEWTHHICFLRRVILVLFYTRKEHFNPSRDPLSSERSDQYGLKRVERNFHCWGDRRRFETRGNHGRGSSYIYDPTRGCHGKRLRPSRR